MDIKSTTVICVKRDSVVAMGGDGQITFGTTYVLKSGANKIRKLADGRVLAGFAGAVSDALSLLQRFESKLEEYRGNLQKAAVELARDWRTDKVLRHLEAQLIVADKEKILLISGTGDVIEPDEGVIAIGSGAPYAMAAAKALLRETQLSAEEIVKKSLEIASEICIYTNKNIRIEVLKV